MKVRGPALLFAAWAIHDIEEALTFPAACNDAADRTGIDCLRIGKRQSWTAIGIMGVIVGAACWRGQRTGGQSMLYRAILAGLEAHVYTHLAASIAKRGYTPGVVTAVPVMLPGAIAARRELHRSNIPLRTQDFIMGACLLVPSAMISHALARLGTRSAPRWGDSVDA
ncbi:HXXEE domain-containing protein [Leucobacter sp. BZR 635]